MLFSWHLFFIFLFNSRFFKAIKSNKNDDISFSRPLDEMAVSDLARNLIYEIQSKAPNSLLAEHVQEALQNAAEELNLPNPENDDCERDYTRLCPQHWLPRGDGHSCRAHLQYTGSCQHLVNFSDFSPLKKSDFAIECNVTWPCKAPACIQDVSAPCPMHFLVQDDGSCLASSLYHGKCVRKMSFKNYSRAHRLLWTEICNVFWPCRNPCSNKIISICPRYWSLSHSKKYCIAPLEYLGPCSPVQPVSMKKEIMTKNCGVQYDCDKIIKSSKDIQSCQQDYASMCPFEWKVSLLNSSICEAPFPYKGPCPLRFSFINYTMIMKKQFSKACNVYWPCKTATQPAQKKKTHLKEVFSHVYNESSFENTEITQSLPHVEKRNQAHTKLLREFASAAKQYLPREISVTLQNAINDLSQREKDVVLMYTMRNASQNPSASSRFFQFFRNTSLPATQLPKEETLLSEKYYDTKQIIYPHLYKQVQSKSKAHTGRLVENPYYLKQLDDFEARIDPYGTLANQNIGYLQQNNCIRDYTAPCPIGWSLTTTFESITSLKSSSCIALYRVQYESKCNPVQPFPIMSKSQKQLAEIKCRIAWPCRKCHHDYLRPPCPQGWIHEGDGFCRISPELVKNKSFDFSVKSQWCSPALNFKFMVPELRQLWSKICGYDWPCFQTCERDFSSPCPHHWKQVKDKAASSKDITICIPLQHNSIEMHAQPNSFPCGRKLVVPLNILDRYLLESNCNIKWPCQELCKMDFKKPCPYGYTVKPRTGECLPPPFIQSSSSLPHNNICFSSTRFPYWFGTKRKKKFSKLCHAPWPCENMCDEDFSFLCPVHWKLKKEKQQIFCIPNKTYKGPCLLRKYDVTAFTLLSKWEFAWTCQVKWPCKGKVHFRFPRLPFLSKQAKL
ncbi:uncharacterized protein LOC128882635 isoform X2 [Hylaeus volcanicus]|uniref:uncharacterized protein LOC128882635 isoform X2 n=1 Tax=Hylaeus volcanicus TaxID=313075 RepID=UPI0023B8086E|nr:uncharacterized protein LOC128882635 isoform X2 [Hylaeus volcanicus]